MTDRPISTRLRYVRRVTAAEISTVARFVDEVVQCARLDHDTGLLLDLIDAPDKRLADRPTDVPYVQQADARRVVLLNGNLNHTDDIQGLLEGLRERLTRHDRLAIVLYNPYLRSLYRAATALKLRRGEVPGTFVRERELRNLAALSGFEIVRIRPTAFVPFNLPPISWAMGKLLPTAPLLNRLALNWVVWLRPMVTASERPSLSIVIPARNEKGNIEAALQRLPPIEGVRQEVIFVEGHSSDATWEEIQRVMPIHRDRFEIQAFQQTGKGKNDAVRLGFAQATGDVVTILDADLTMPPELIPRFYEAYASGRADFINGNRLTYPMEGDAMRPLNRMGNLFFAKVLGGVLQLPIGDSLCGTKMFARRDYQRITQWRDRFGDFDPFGDFEMLFGAAELALGAVDMPIRYRARTYGSTNIARFRDGLKLLWMTLIGFARVRCGKTR